jgi:hypothetical protein
MKDGVILWQTNTFMAECDILTEMSICSGKLLQHLKSWSFFGAVTPIQEIIWTHQYRKIHFHANFVFPYSKYV